MLCRYYARLYASSDQVTTLSLRRAESGLRVVERCTSLLHFSRFSPHATMLGGRIASAEAAPGGPRERASAGPRGGGGIAARRWPRRAEIDRGPDPARSPGIADPQTARGFGLDEALSAAV